jgi:hypothetical protein
LPAGGDSCQMTTVLTTTVTTVGPATTPATAPRCTYRAWSRLLLAPGSVGVRGSSPLSSTSRRFKSCQPDRGKQRLSCGNECASASHRSNHATLGECRAPRARCEHLEAHVSAGQVVAGSVLAARVQCVRGCWLRRERTLSRAQGVNVRRWRARQRSLCRS